MINSKSKILNLKRLCPFVYLHFRFISNLRPQSSDSCHKRNGFTLVEAIIYLAIVSIILVSISYLILDIMGSQSKNYAFKEVDQNLRFISNNLTRDIKAASAITSLSSTTLVLALSAGAITYNFDGANKKITRQVGSNPAADLNSGQVEVLGSFSDLSYVNRTENIGIHLGVNYKNPDNLPDFRGSAQIDFAVELRGRR
jgi:type II secretory pathway pseudopilin PulG